MTAAPHLDDRPTPRPMPSIVAAPGRASRVLLATDLRPSSAAATKAAIGLARDLRASLVVVTVVEPPRSSPFGLRIDQLRERSECGVRDIASHARELGVDTAFLVWEGEPGPSVVAAAEAEGADIVVLGSSGRPRVTRLLLGSVSEHVLHASPCPVLVVRPEEGP